MHHHATKSELVAQRQQLLELCQRTDFGWIENLKIRTGQPVLDPLPRVIQTLKLGTAGGPRPESELEDFQLKQPVLDLFHTIDQIGNGRILRIDVRHGLPCSIHIEGGHGAE